MNIEEIIPFLIFVFWVVRSIITQKRKAEEQRKRAPKPAPNKTYTPDKEPRPKRRPPIIFESEEPEIDILEELFGNKEEKKQETYEPAIQPVIITDSAREKELKEKRIALEMKREYEKEKLDFNKETAESFALKQVHVKGKGKFAHSKLPFGRFNLKKAVIFSEILKRPYE